MFSPIISRPLFTARYRTFLDSHAHPSDKWLATLNMIFAIRSKHAHLLEAPWQGDERDHLVYLTRARILSMNRDVLFSHPDLQQVQIEGLIAFYLSLKNHAQGSNQLSNAGDHHYQPYPTFLPHVSLRPNGASSLSSEGPVMDDLYFPYDPISGEFIRSFFPQPNEDGNWDPN